MSAASRLVSHFYDTYSGRVPISVAFGMGLAEIFPFVYEDRAGHAMGLIALGVVRDEHVEVVQIFHMSVFHPRVGTGAKMLREICAVADRLAVILTGTPMFLSNGRDARMSDDALAGWYRRHGFRGARFLHREPRTPPSSA